MMGPRAKLTAMSAGGVRTWLQFALGAALLIGIATSIDLANTAARGSLGSRALGSFVFALELVAGAAIVGSVLWVVMRLLRGKYAVQDFRDSVLWSAYLVAAIVVMVRLMR